MVYLLLQDGLNRAYRDAEIGEMMQQNMRLLNVHHIAELNPQIDSADVVYLDPMYPHKQKSALVKKKCVYSNIWLVQIWMPMSS